MRAIILPLFAVVAWAQVKLPVHERRVLPNGVVLILAPKPDVPMLTLLAVARGGQEADPPDKAGLTSATAEMLTRGAGNLDERQFTEQLESLGANVRTRVNEQSVTLRIDTLSRHADAAIRLFASAVLKPRFDAAESKKLLEERIDAAKNLKDDPGEANGAYFRPFFFGSAHPYGRPLDGDELSLAKLDAPALRAQHARLFAGANLVVVAAGDVSASAAAALQRELAAAPRGQQLRWSNAPPPAHTKPRLLLVDKPDATQTYFMIATPGIHRTHPDRDSLWVVNTLFGDRFTSMLNDELRVNTGLTYGARSDLHRNRLTGAIAIRTFTKTETTGKAIDLALELVKRLRTKGLDAEQLQSAKAYIKGMYPTQSLETAAQTAAALADLELNGLGPDEIDGLFARIDAVTLEQANAAARKYYRDANLQFCLTGAASKIHDAVSKYAETRKVVAITEPGVRPGDF